MKPVVAIVGRPNVGKSTLFNKLIGERAAIVKDVPGVTRDRLYRDIEWSGHEFLLVDTGGLEPNTKDYIMSKVRYQAEVAIEEADVVVFIVDGQAGVTALDEEVAYVLRKKNKHVILAVNKIDNLEKHSELVYEFYGLGFENFIAISGEHKQNLGDLLDLVIEKFKDIELIEEEEGLRIAVIGRPNVGKSSLVNKLMGEERTIVSNIAGTTRDAIDTKFEYDGNSYVLIDTAGIRRKSKVEESLEYYSVLRAIKSIKRANICFVLIDSKEGVTDQDKRIAGLAFEEKKPIIIVINKWDLVKKDNYTMKDYEKEVKDQLPFLSYAPVIFISALTGQRVLKLIEKSEQIFAEYTKKITTGVLNQVLKEAMMLNPVPTRKGRVVKINYATQIRTAPPKFVLFANNPDLLHFSYLRYLENKIREAFGFEGSPIEFTVRRKGKDD
ncbi:ribosome biogenesis GTPase Der [Haliovirga abyssi]|uniref:GTPase Der n=1 Tax=Haliovirga abyssi TaxID=2996794 RepID=A0AAU9D0W3_9FUSO|nr:ribosome biogenesis GTPase Der [Haliovirga abyssi]BDU49609.1 GTPase Der [Haliovirga abyssi]